MIKTNIIYFITDIVYQNILEKNKNIYDMIYDVSYDILRWKLQYSQRCEVYIK